MSSRQLRRMCAPKKPDDDEEQFDPSNEKSGNSFQHLMRMQELSLSSFSDEEPGLPVYEDNAQESSDEELTPEPVKKSKKKKKHKKTPAIFKDGDEIDRAVMEVNMLQGEAGPLPASPSPVRDTRCSLFKVNYKFLDPKAELTRLFEPVRNEGRRVRVPTLQPHRRKIAVLEENERSLNLNGISMEKLEMKDGAKYFKLVHDPKYTANLRQLIMALRFSNHMPLNFHELPRDTLEGVMEMVDFFFVTDNHRLAAEALEGLVVFIQSIVAPSFNYFDGNTRLEYAHVENRPFHIILLKYLHLLTNKSCHRTALEIAKLLLNLDPSDPLAIIFIIDVLALRARKHQWFIDVYEKWAKEKDAGCLFNMIYSRALAQYHVYIKSKLPEHLEEATKYLKEAIIKYPNVAVRILELCGYDVKDFSAHELHTSGLKESPADLLGLQRLHCAFVWPRWREDSNQWLASTFRLICQQYDDPKTNIKTEALYAQRHRFALFKKTPIQIKRHLSVITAMSQLLVEGAVPEIKATHSFNPFPEEGHAIDVRNYYNQPTTATPTENLLRSFLASWMPDAGPPHPPNDH